MKSYKNRRLGKIVVIGGGSRSGMKGLLQPVIDLCEKPNPTVTVIPTASGTSDGERVTFENLQASFSALTPNVQALYLLGETPSSDDLKSKILESDAVYVPGGNVRLMLLVWRKVGLVRLLKRAFQNGVVMSGRSAGAVCWCASALGADEHGPKTRFMSYRKNNGLGFIDITLCAHYEARREGFRVMLDTFGSPGIGLESGAALVVDGDEFYTVSQDGGKVYLVTTEHVFFSETELSSEVGRRHIRDLGL